MSLGAVAVGDNDESRPSLLFDPSLQHFRGDEAVATAGTAGDVLQPQTALFDELVELRGPSCQSFTHTAASTESAWTTYVLEQRRDVHPHVAGAWSG